MELAEAISRLKKLPFSKSWLNAYVGKDKNIVCKKTGLTEKTHLDFFIYLPAPSILMAYSNDKDFLAFRVENKFSGDLNFNLMPDKTENNNRRIGVMYVARYLDAAGIDFLIDDSFTIYILKPELDKLHESEKPELKDFYSYFCIPKHFGGRKGVEETFS